MVSATEGGSTVVRALNASLFQRRACRARRRGSALARTAQQRRGRRAEPEGGHGKSRLGLRVGGVFDGGGHLGESDWASTLDIADIATPDDGPAVCVSIGVSLAQTSAQCALACVPPCHCGALAKLETCAVKCGDSHPGPPPDRRRRPPAQREGAPTLSAAAVRSSSAGTTDAGDAGVRADLAAARRRPAQFHRCTPAAAAHAARKCCTSNSRPWSTRARTRNVNSATMRPRRRRGGGKVIATVIASAHAPADGPASRTVRMCAAHGDHGATSRRPTSVTSVLTQSHRKKTSARAPGAEAPLGDRQDEQQHGDVAQTNPGVVSASCDVGRRHSWRWWRSRQARPMWRSRSWWTAGAAVRRGHEPDDDAPSGTSSPAAVDRAAQASEPGGRIGQLAGASDGEGHLGQHRVGGEGEVARLPLRAATCP